MGTATTPDRLLAALDAKGDGRAERPASDDGALLRRAQSGDAAASRALVQRHGPRIFRIVAASFRDRALAADVVQETFVRALYRSSELRAEESAFAWLLRIAIRIAQDERRRTWRVVLPGELASEALDPSPTADDRLVAHQDAAVVQAALERLPARWRTVLVLRYYGGLSAAEIAATLEKSEPAVRKDLERAREALRKRLATWFGAEGGGR